MLSTHRGTLNARFSLDLRGVFDAATVEALASSIDAGRLVAAPANDPDSILDALPGFGDEQVRRVSGAWDDRSRG